MDRIGINAGPLIFLLTHFTYFIVTLLYALLQYHFKWFNLFCILALLLQSAWNGACFYMEYFCKKYELELAKLQQIEVKAKKE